MERVTERGLKTSRLRDNGYRILPEMEPLIDVYSKEGMVFLAMKLSGGKGTQDIQPVSMTYKSEKPMISYRNRQCS